MGTGIAGCFRRILPGLQHTKFSLTSFLIAKRFSISTIQL